MKWCCGHELRIHRGLDSVVLERRGVKGVENVEKSSREERGAKGTLQSLYLVLSVRLYFSIASA